LKSCADGSVISLDGCNNLPLGVSEDEKYEEVTRQLRPYDQIVFYTDGITEALNPAGDMYGVSRLDGVLGRCQSANDLIGAVLASLEDFTQGEPAFDDRTLLVAKVS